MTWKIGVDDINEDVDGSGIWIFEESEERPRLLLPFRTCWVRHAIKVDDERLFVIAEHMNDTLKSFFGALIDVRDGDVLRTSIPVVGFLPDQLATTPDGRHVIGNYMGKLVAWSLPTLLTEGPMDLIERRSGGHYYSSTQNYSHRHRRYGEEFYSRAHKDFYNEGIKNGTLEIARGNNEFAVSSNGKIIISLDQFGVPTEFDEQNKRIDKRRLNYLIDPETWKVSPLTHVSHTSATSSSAMTKTYEFEAELAAQAAELATIHVELNDTSAESCATALDKLAEELAEGLDTIRFGHTVNVRAKLGAEVLNEVQLVNVILTGEIEPVYDYKLVGTFEDRSATTYASLEKVVSNFVLFRGAGGQLYHSTEFGMAAFEVFAAALAMFDPGRVDPIRKFYRSTDLEHSSGHMIDRIVRQLEWRAQNGDHLRLAVFALLELDNCTDVRHVLNVAEKHMSGEEFFELAIEEIKSKASYIASWRGHIVSPAQVEHRNIQASLRLFSDAPRIKFGSDFVTAQANWRRDN